MRIVGLDLSLTATGFCDDYGPQVVKPPAKMAGMARLEWYRELVAFGVAGSDLVLLEGYSYSSRQGGERLGELGGVIRWTLWTNHIPYMEIPPATLKKFATGKGNAPKDTMVATAARLGCPANDNNAVDAWWLYQLGRFHYESLAYITTTAYRTETAGKIDWPVMPAQNPAA